MIITRKEARERGLTRYYTGKAFPHGHVAERQVSNATCVDCVSLRRDAWALDNPHKRKEYDKKSRAKSKDSRAAYNREWAKKNPDRFAEIHRMWKEENRERVRANQRRWQIENKERVRENQRRWAADNPERMRAKKLRRRGAEMRAEGTHNGEDIKRILEAQRHKCAYCGLALKRGYHVDHIVALSKGGSNWPSNLQCLCPKCNRSKGAKDQTVFLRERGYLI